MTAEASRTTGPVLRWPLVAGAMFGLLAVMAGAFGAHGLRQMVSERALALVLVAVLVGFGLSRHLLGIAAGFYLAGILMFSGSLYLLVFTGYHWLGPVTPLGGVCFMIGWGLLVTAGLRRQR